MSVTVWDQARCLMGAVVLGLATGLLYDLLRVIRWRVRGRIFGGILDLLFWLVTTAALFLWSVDAGQGVVQVSTCLFLFLGAAVYFRFLSPLLLPPLSWLLRIFGRLIHFTLAPFRLLKRFTARTKKFFSLFCKKHFSFTAK